MRFYFSFRMNVLERNAWFGPLDKIFVPKWEWREIPELGIDEDVRAERRSRFLTTRGGIQCTNPRLKAHPQRDTYGMPEGMP
jgi:hypothetical protein